MTPCHEPHENVGGFTTEQHRTTCGHCGGDRRRVILANVEAVEAEYQAGVVRAAARWEAEKAERARAAARAAHRVMA